MAASSRRALADAATRLSDSVQIGQVWEDTHVTNSKGRWLVKVMKLNAKSARVEPCADNGWFTLAGYGWQYRMEAPYFTNGRMRLVHDPDKS